MGEPVKLSTLDRRTEFKRILLIGESGTGKTRFVGTMPKPFIADFDRGLTTIAGHETALAKDFTGDRGWQEFQTELKLWRKDGPQYGCETFALDSLSTAADACLLGVMTKAGNPSGQPDRGQWGQAIREIKDLMAHLTTLRCHVIVTAHLSIEQDELLGGIIYQPSIYGKELPSKLPVYFDEVWLSDVKISQKGTESVADYRIQVMPDQRIKIIKSRLAESGTLSKHVVPDFTTILNTPARSSK